MEINRLIKLEKYCEDNKKCPNCKKISLVGCSPEELLFMCQDCGNYYTYNEKTNRITGIKAKKED